MARILVIDDSQDMLVMLQMILEKRGHHTVSTCHNGNEGLQVATTDLPDLAIVDVTMPGMSGYEVVQHLRANPDTKNMGLLILTARGQPVDREAAFNAGADGHIAKPVNMDDLLAQVEALLDRKQQEALKATPSATQPTPAAAQPSPSTPQPASPSSSQEMVFPFFSLKGGVGRSTLAVNLAILLQQIAPTVLWDLSPNSGHCGLFLGLRPEKHWGHYLENVGMDVTTLLLRHQSGLALLAAPPVPGQSGWFSDEDIEAVQRRLHTTARFVVVDMPPVLNSAATLILKRAQRILLVTGDDGPAIQTTRFTLQAIQEWQARVLLVRNASRPGVHPPVEALQRALQAPLQGDIPYEPAQHEAVYKGVPVVALQPQAAFAAGIKRLAKLALTR